MYIYIYIKLFFLIDFLFKLDKQIFFKIQDFTFSGCAIDPRSLVVYPGGKYKINICKFNFRTTDLLALGLACEYSCLSYITLSVPKRQRAIRGGYIRCPGASFGQDLCVAPITRLSELMQSINENR